MKEYKRYLFISMLMIGSAFSVHAKDKVAKPDVASNKLKAWNAVKKYAEAMACTESFETKPVYLNRDKLPVKKKISPSEAEIFSVRKQGHTDAVGNRYYVLWHGDDGCYGGSGTSSYFISAVRSNAGNKPFSVYAKSAFGKAIENTINFRLIQSIEQISPTHFNITASMYGKDDAQCCPSLLYTYTLKYQNKKSGWVITKKTLVQKGTHTSN